MSPVTLPPLAPAPVLSAAAAVSALTTFDGEPLEAEQTAVVMALLARSRASADDSVTYEYDGVPIVRPSQMGPQRFLDFGGLAYEVSAPGRRPTGYDDSEIELIGVLVDGCGVLEMPDEGQCGVLHLIRTHRGGTPEHWRACCLNRGWLWTREVASAGNAEIDAESDALMDSIWLGV